MLTNFTKESKSLSFPYQGERFYLRRKSRYQLGTSKSLPRTLNGSIHQSHSISLQLGLGVARFLLEVQLPRLGNKAPLSPFFLENVKQAKKMTQSTVTNTETDRRLERQIGRQSDKSPLGEWSKKKKKIRAGRSGVPHQGSASLSHVSYRKPALGLP